MLKTDSNKTKDYLLVDEITKDAVSELKLNYLYRTHVNLHNSIEKNIITDNFKNAHKIVADELSSRGLLHHLWDNLDSIYYKN